jgi:hypothetical protein
MVVELTQACGLKVESETRKESLQPSPRKPLCLATIPYRGHWYHRALIFALNLLLVVLGFVGYVVLRTPAFLGKCRGPASMAFWRGTTKARKLALPSPCQKVQGGDAGWVAGERFGPCPPGVRVPSPPLVPSLPEGGVSSDYRRTVRAPHLHIPRCGVNDITTNAS